MKKLELVACICTNGAIGKNGKQVYYIKEDLRHFKNLTSGGIVIMGHKTQEDLPIGYLPNRVNIVMTRDNDLLKGEKYVAWDEGYYVNGVDNLEKLLDEKFADVTVPIFVIGGQQVYESLLKYVYLTVLKPSFSYRATLSGFWVSRPSLYPCGTSSFMPCFISFVAMP